MLFSKPRLKIRQDIINRKKVLQLIVEKKFEDFGQDRQLGNELVIICEGSPPLNRGSIIHNLLIHKEIQNSVC